MARVAVYLRVSTTGQTVENQRLELEAWAERAMIRERVNAGLARAKTEGKQLGRPRVGAELERRVRELRAEGKGVKAVAHELEVGVGTVQRIDREAREEAAACRPTLADGSPAPRVDP